MAFFAIAAELGIATGAWLLNKYALSERKKTPKPRPEDFDFPRTSVGTPVPIIYGTVRVDNLLLVELAEVGTEINSNHSAYQYNASMIFVIGTPPSKNFPVLDAAAPPELLRFWYGDAGNGTSLLGGGLSHGNHTNGSFGLGGPGAGGSFDAIIEFHDGRADQVASSYPARPDTELAKFYRRQMFAPVPRDIARIPGYQYQMLFCVFAANSADTPNTSVGESARLNNIAAEVRCQGYRGSEINGFDHNPAWAIYDFIVGNEHNKVGFPAEKVDLDSFTAAAAVFQNEKHGCSALVQTKEDAGRIIGGLLDQTNSICYVAHSTGKITLKPIRGGYSVDDLEHITDATTLERPDVTLQGWPDAYNQVDVSFTNRDLDYKQDTATAQRLSNSVQQNSRSRPLSVSYPSCMDAVLAKKLADRELATVSRPFMMVQARVQRVHHALDYGDPVKGSWAGVCSEKVFRVLDIDRGQPNDSSIRLTLIEDIFPSQPEAPPLEIVTVFFPYLRPVHERLLTEAPAWLQALGYTQGILRGISPDPLAYSLSIAANVDDPYGFAMGGKSTSFFSPPGLEEDSPFASVWRYFATIKTAYPRWAEPFDNGLGLELESISPDLENILSLLGDTVLPDSTPANGGNLTVLYDPATQEHEFISFTSQTTISGGRKLTNVWRGLMDTTPRDWPVGTRVVFINRGPALAAMGRIPRSEGSVVERQLVPQSTGLVFSGSGDDPIETYEFKMRAAKPLPVADFCLFGYSLEGEQGIPASTGHLKRVTVFDGSGQIYGTSRLRTKTTITRGDASSETPESPEVYDLILQKVGGSEIVLQASLPSPQPFTPLDFLVGGAGHGEIDVKLRTKNLLRSSWTTPTIRVTAPHWRNLLANSQGTFADTAVPSAHGWDNVTGTVQSSQGTSSPSRSSTDCYFTSATASAGVTAFSQTVSIAGFKPSGMQGSLDFLYQNISADSDDTITVEIEMLDGGGSPIDTASIGPLTGSSARWMRDTLEFDISDDTQSLRVTVTLTAVGGGDTVPSTAFALPDLRIGQCSAQLLTNPSFE